MASMLFSSFDRSLRTSVDSQQTIATSDAVIVDNFTFPPSLAQQALSNPEDSDYETLYRSYENVIDSSSSSLKDSAKQQPFTKKRSSYVTFRRTWTSTSIQHKRKSRATIRRSSHSSLYTIDGVDTTNMISFHEDNESSWSFKENINAEDDEFWEFLPADKPFRNSFTRESPAGVISRSTTVTTLRNSIQETESSDSFKQKLSKSTGTIDRKRSIKQSSSTVHKILAPYSPSTLSDPSSLSSLQSPIFIPLRNSSKKNAASDLSSPSLKLVSKKKSKGVVPPKYTTRNQSSQAIPDLIASNSATDPLEELLKLYGGRGSGSILRLDDDTSEGEKVILEYDIQNNQSASSTMDHVIQNIQIVHPSTQELASLSRQNSVRVAIVIPKQELPLNTTAAVPSTRQQILNALRSRIVGLMNTSGVQEFTKIDASLATSPSVSMSSHPLPKTHVVPSRPVTSPTSAQFPPTQQQYLSMTPEISSRRKAAKGPTLPIRTTSLNPTTIM
ncbi:UNVERIFIED_CONTAM: hypothetical protein HDU68_002140 [Siphonaria sp. JEL0065]|nr:hypothetical protein HDU68_002140 [Siphonaria sp. JEL0065]